MTLCYCYLCVLLLEFVGFDSNLAGVHAILDHVILCATRTSVHFLTQVFEEQFLFRLTHQLLCVCCYCVCISHNFIIHIIYVLSTYLICVYNIGTFKHL